MSKQSKSKSNKPNSTKPKPAAKPTEPAKKGIWAIWEKKKKFIKNNKKLSIIIGAAILVILAVVLILLLKPKKVDDEIIDDTPPPVPVVEVATLETMVVPFNPGGTADLMARALLNQVAPEISIHNIHGANGADGLNEVFEDSLGESVLCTSLSSMVNANLTGFTATESRDWEHWLTAYSPSIIAVAANSPYTTLDELIVAGAETPLICANAGAGTLSYIGAHLFENAAGITLEHKSSPGTNPAVSEVRDGAADFIIAQSAELAGVLRNGELRALASFSDGTIDISGVDAIPPAVSTLSGLSDVVPFGEYFGLMLPHDTPEKVLREYDEMWATAANSEGFHAFAAERGLFPLDANRQTSNQTAERMSEIIEKNLIETGYINER